MEKRRFKNLDKELWLLILKKCYENKYIPEDFIKMNLVNKKSHKILCDDENKRFIVGFYERNFMDTLWNNLFDYGGIGILTVDVEIGKKDNRVDSDFISTKFPDIIKKLKRGDLLCVWVRGILMTSRMMKFVWYNDQLISCVDPKHRVPYFYKRE